MTAQTSSRFKILERPTALPGKCAVCGAVDRPVLDFGFDLDWYGVVYFCTDCLTEIGQTIGMVSRDELVAYEGKFEQSLSDYLLQHDYSLVTNEFLYDAVRSFDRLSNLAVSILPSGVLPDDSELPQADDASAGDIPSEPVGSEQDSGKSSNSASRKRRNIVSADSGDGTDELFSS